MLSKPELAVRTGAWIALAGFILSAPIAFPIVMLIAPQPEWVSVEIFKANYHHIQELPYYLGFILISGMVVLVYSHKPENYAGHPTIQSELGISRVLITIFATLVIFNYICQTTLIPHLVKDPSTMNDSMIAAFTMSNPDSLSWAIEMWGYLIMAKALWLLRGCYRNQITSLPLLFVVNLIMSIISVVWTIIDPYWVGTTLGLVLYFAWNVLMIMILVFIIRISKRNSHLYAS
ncbi:MAG TPA: hypothetical protein VFV79_07790 [Saprospiraceae bacterium]|nr:hypothetical protein [Saprospiraceae bacterium]